MTVQTKLTWWIDFRVIPLGDLNLLHASGLGDGFGIVHRQRHGASVRWMYSARIHGSQMGVTAAVYEGETAEQVCFGVS